MIIKTVNEEYRNRLVFYLDKLYGMKPEIFNHKRVEYFLGERLKTNFEYKLDEKTFSSQVSRERESLEIDFASCSIKGSQFTSLLGANRMMVWEITEILKMLKSQEEKDQGTKDFPMEDIIDCCFITAPIKGEYKLYKIDYQLAASAFDSEVKQVIKKCISHSWYETIDDVLNWESVFKENLNNHTKSNLVDVSGRDLFLSSDENGLKLSEKIPASFNHSIEFGIRLKESFSITYFSTVLRNTLEGESFLDALQTLFLSEISFEDIHLEAHLNYNKQISNALQIRSVVGPDIRSGFGKEKKSVNDFLKTYTDNEVRFEQEYLDFKKKQRVD